MMGKLVLYLPDGTLHDIPLDKERVSIGRRPDNDVCLPYPAVSGEHAAVVNILDDSFLEDLGSTNGTLVNGKAIVKHFLRDNDLIDIGRQRLVYFSDVNTRADPLPPDILRRDIQGLQEQVERARSPRPPEPRKAPVAAPGASGPRTVDPLSPDDELLADLETAGFPGDKKVAPPVPAAPLERMVAEPPVQPARPTTPPVARPPKRPDPSAVAARLASTWAETPVASEAAPAQAAPKPKTAAASYAIRVLTGASAGRELAVTRDEVSVGRVGTQVARIMGREGSWRLARVEGAEPVLLNGAAVPEDGAPLSPGDRFVVAGVELLFDRR
jgi:predicted component of type VI protein secretion system